MLPKTNVTQAEVAARLCVKVQTVERWRQLGVGPRFMKIESNILYRIKDVEEYEEKCLRESTSKKLEKGSEE